MITESAVPADTKSHTPATAHDITSRSAPLDATGAPSWATANARSVTTIETAETGPCLRSTRAGLKLRQARARDARLRPDGRQRPDDACGADIARGVGHLGMGAPRDSVPLRPTGGRPSSGRPSSGRPSSGRPSSGRPSLVVAPPVVAPPVVAPPVVAPPVVAPPVVAPPVVAPPVVAPPVVANPSAQPVPKTDLPGWRNILWDDFTEEAALGSWRNNTGSAEPIVYTGNEGQQWRAYPTQYLDTFQKRPYQSEILEVANSTLIFNLQPVDGQPAGANPSPLIKDGSQYQTYGVIRPG